MDRLMTLRGATTSDENTVEAINEATRELMEEIIRLNELQEAQVVHVIFSATSDLTAQYPSVVLRQQLGWDQTAILNVEEKKVIPQLQQCIRVMITIQTEKAKTDLHHVYLKEAAKLRPDWSGSLSK